VVEVIGTGKRTGKTAVAGHFASLLRECGIDPVILSMGRGGPPEPQLIHAHERPDLDALRQIARSGRHAASDYLEDAVLAGVSCVGCRRTGEGLAGEVFESNVLEGAALALSLEPDVLLVEGSGACVPPIASDRTVCVTNASRAPTEALRDLGPYRLLGSDLIVLLGADALPGTELADLRRSLANWAEGASIVGCRFEPEPAGEVRRGARVALFTTARDAEEELVRALGKRGVDIAVYSPHLARRFALERDLERAEREGCDVFLTELKAAAIELVAERAERTGAEVVFLKNKPVSLTGEPELDAELLGLIEQRRLVDRAGAARPAGPVT
jgi:cyclic 2,3-diphosphoglycerate synthetase